MRVEAICRKVSPGKQGRTARTPHHHPDAHGWEGRRGPGGSSGLSGWKGSSWEFFHPHTVSGLCDPGPAIKFHHRDVCWFTLIG